jgi:hypothetical protein
MVTSTWAAQFIEVGERLGDAALGWREAEATFELLPKIRRAAPRLYGVGSGERQGLCQVRRACCFSYTAPAGQHCMLCPLISADERAQRSRTWAASRAQIRVLDPAVVSALREKDGSTT